MLDRKFDEIQQELEKRSCPVKISMYDEKKVEQEKKRRMEKYLFLMEIKDLIEDDIFENHWVDDVSDLLDDILPIVQDKDFIENNNDEIK